METIKRQKIVERDHFTAEEKMLIAKKSNDRCCNCGKKVFFGYGATIEHFVPLSKGGTNRDINIVMLCKNCNDEKNNFIYRPEDYLKYLKDEHFDKLKGYFDSYIQSFDFINRDNLLACDRYKVFVNPLSYNVHQQLSHRKNRDKYDKFIMNNSKEYWVKRATIDDVDKLTKYFIKYLKKYNCLDSEDSARVNIEFWIRFGCIYYIEKNDEIKTLVTVTVTKANECVLIKNKTINSFLTMNVFTYYSNDSALTLAWNLSRQIPKYITQEQHLSQIPVKYCVLNEDSLAMPICDGGYINTSGRFMSSFMILYDAENKEDLSDLGDDENLNNFFNRFKKINAKKIDKWFENHDSETIEWMLYELDLDPIGKEGDRKISIILEDEPE